MKGEVTEKTWDGYTPEGQKEASAAARPEATAAVAAVAAQAAAPVAPAPTA